MTIEPVKEDDVIEVAKVMMSAYKDEPWNEKWTLEKAELRVNAILGNYKGFGLKAYDENGIQGALLGFVDPYAEDSDFYVSELFVKSEKKRKGIGSQLLHELYNYLREERIETIQLMSIVSNQPFYEKNGMLRDNVGVMYAKVDP